MSDELQVISGDSGVSEDPREKPQTMKVVGGRNPLPFWERFNRLQRTAGLVLGRPLGPKGVFRFKTHEEYDEWKKNLSLGPPMKRT